MMKVRLSFFLCGQSVLSAHSKYSYSISISHLWTLISYNFNPNYLFKCATKDPTTKSCIVKKCLI